MTRMWMADPSIMCVQHINGEHKEIHHLICKLRDKFSLTNYFKNNCLEMRSIAARHNELQEEAIKRGYKWNRTLLTEEDYDYSYLPLEEQHYTIDREASLEELIRRCPECCGKYREGELKK